jgi:hypothetical protein
MSLLSEVLAMAEEGPDKKANPVIAVLSVSVKGRVQSLPIKRHSQPEKLAREFMAEHGVAEKSFGAIVEKIRAMAEEGE